MSTRSWCSARRASVRTVQGYAAHRRCPRPLSRMAAHNRHVPPDRRSGRQRRRRRPRQCRLVQIARAAQRSERADAARRCAADGRHGAVVSADRRRRRASLSETCRRSGPFPHSFCTARSTPGRPIPMARGGPCYGVQDRMAERRALSPRVLSGDAPPHGLALEPCAPPYRHADHRARSGDPGAGAHSPAPRPRRFLRADVGAVRVRQDAGQRIRPYDRGGDDLHSRERMAARDPGGAHLVRRVSGDRRGGGGNGPGSRCFSSGRCRQSAGRGSTLSSA